MKYADYITMQDFLPVYDMAEEQAGSWNGFIPTKQFCELLQKTLKATTSTTPAQRKSMWVRGTFGTGKSHAASVIKHLLCDNEADTANYRSNIKNDSLRAQLDNIRQGFRLFPIVLKGVEGAYDIPSFTLSLQRATMAALEKAGYTDMVVKSDYDAAQAWIEEHRAYTEDIIAQTEELAVLAPTADKLLERLHQLDSTTYLTFARTLRDSLGVHLTQANISEWLTEVEKEIENKQIANGLIIFWDEFTSVMDTLKSDRINVLQNIAEKSATCNLFLFLISHRAEQQSLDNKGRDISKMSDRFDIVEYKMDELSTYVIMRHAFYIKDGENTQNYQLLRYNLTHSFEQLLNHLSEQGTTEERDRIRALFPLHPYTAFLCSKLSNQIGSANRTVIRFMNDDKYGFKQFINDDNTCYNRQLLTADRLWDFFFEVFEQDPTCHIFTNAYGTHEARVAAMTDGHLRVFKTILLLNALNSKFSKEYDIERLIPNDTNLHYIYAGDSIEPHLDQILDFLDHESIVPRNVFGDFKLQMSTYNPAEVAKAKAKVESDYKTSAQILTYNYDSLTDLKSIFKVELHLIRRCELQVYACEEQEGLLRSRLSKYMNSAPNDLHIVLFTALTKESRDAMEERVKTMAHDFRNAILILPEETLTMENYQKLLTMMANMQVAQSHANQDAAQEYSETAKAYIGKWVGRLINGVYDLYFNDQHFSESIIKNLPIFINKKLSPLIFCKGLESVKQIQSAASTYFSTKKAPKLVGSILQAKTREQIRFTGEAVPSRFIFEDEEGNYLIDEQCELKKEVKDSNYWIVEICRKVDQLMAKAQKDYADRFSLSEVLAPLMRPPYGFFSSKANWVALGYALRKHKANLYLPSTSQPVSDEKLTDMVKILFNMWGEGDSSANSKLNLRFGSPEESKLKDQITEIFQLQNYISKDEIKSWENAKWGLREFCTQYAHQPLWTLKYCDKINEEQKKTIDLLLNIMEQETPSPERIKELSHRLEHYIDLFQLVNEQNNYDTGLHNYVNGLDGIEIEPEWWNELLAELNTLPAEVAYRKESDVQNRIWKFYTQKLKGPQPNNDEELYSDTEHADIPTPNVPDTNLNNTSTPSVASVEKAREIVRSTSMPAIFWQKIMLDLLEEFPSNADFIVQHLQD